MKYIKKYNENIEWLFDEEENPKIHPDFEGHEDFYNFLIKNGVLDDYIKHFNKPDSIFSDNNLKDFLDNKKPEYYIDNAFNWVKTKNELFWSNLSLDWSLRNGRS